MKTTHTSQSGLVVIMALFIIAIVAALSYAMLASLARDTHRTIMLVNDAELTYYAEGGIAWAKDVLVNNVLKKTANQRIDKMPLVSPVTETNRYRIVTRIEDMQARYNLNRLLNDTPERKNEFAQLLTAVKVTLPEEQLNQLMEAIRDWLNNGDRRPDLNRYYQSLPIPYRTAHQPMAHVSEFRLIKGVTQDIYAKLAPYITALPTVDAPINIFTASPPVLTTLSRRLNLTSAIALQHTVRGLATNDKAQIEKLPILQNHEVKNENYVVVSEYFLVETSVSVESQRLVIYTLMERKETNPKKIGIKIIWQSKGIA